jgi:hypothetical protein
VGNRHCLRNCLSASNLWLFPSHDLSWRSQTSPGRPRALGCDNLGTSLYNLFCISTTYNWRRCSGNLFLIYMKKITSSLFAFIFSLALLFSLSSSVYGQVRFSNIDPGNPTNFKYTNSTLGAVISDLFKYIFGAVGLITFMYVIWSGFRMLISEGNPKNLETARKQLLQAIVGFFIVFSSYWIIQIIEVVFNVQILS